MKANKVIHVFEGAGIRNYFNAILDKGDYYVGNCKLEIL